MFPMNALRYVSWATFLRHVTFRGGECTLLRHVTSRSLPGAVGCTLLRQLGYTLLRQLGCHFVTSRHVPYYELEP